jgi:protein-tyrosine kinase
MDKIQSAIQKARAARLTTLATTAQDGTPTALPVQSSADMNWAALPELQPNADQMERHRIASFGGGIGAVPFDALRTRLLQQMRANNWRRLAITSPGSSSGKTTTCLNLAFSLGRQTDLKTMVIEADLRRPSMAQILGVQQLHLFASVLKGTAPASEHFVRYRNNLAFGTNYSNSEHPAELLHGAQVADVLAGIERDYAPDLMIFDMPPMQVSADTIGFVSRVDCVLLVAAAGITTVAQVDACERELASQTNVLGVVLNKCQYVDRAQGYDYNYGA